MSVWPRRIDRSGQDKPGPTPSTVYIKRRKKKNLQQAPEAGAMKDKPVKRDDQKFEAALTKAIGVKAAKRYMARKRRRDEQDR